jgi:hypothetical protein
VTSPTTTISSSYAGALPFNVDAVHIDALGLNAPYIARHGTSDRRRPEDSKTDMRWVTEQRPDIVEGYLSGRALFRGAGPEEIIGARRRKMILEMVWSSRARGVREPVSCASITRRLGGDRMVAFAADRDGTGADGVKITRCLGHALWFKGRA